MKTWEFIAKDCDILSGKAVFTGTRIPVDRQFNHLEAGDSLEDFHTDFPTVSKEQIGAVLDLAIDLIQMAK